MPNKIHSVTPKEEIENKTPSNVNTGYKYRPEKQVTFMEYPVVEVEIITEKEHLVMRGESRGNIETSEMASDCLNVLTRRDMANDCPTFSVSLIYKDKWFYEIGSNDLIIIKIGRLPNDLSVVFYGLIDDIRKSISFASGKPMRTITLTGRGFSKALVCFEIGTVKEVDPMSGSIISAINTTITNLGGGSPATKAIETLIDEFVKTYIDYNFGDGRSYSSFFNYHPTEKPEEVLLDTTSLMDYQGSLWNLFKELQNAPFNEMFFEIEDERPTLFVRPTPFNEDKWDALEEIELEACNLIEDNIGRSDVETYTIFSVSPRSYFGNSAISETIGVFPLWYEPYYKKYGLKRLSVSTIYTAYADEEDQKDASEKITSYTTDLFNWNIQNNSFFNGTLLVKGDPKYKIGYRLKNNIDNISYYIESVTHNFSIYQSYTTELAVTRGISNGERFNEPIDCFEEIKTVQSLNNTTIGGNYEGDMPVYTGGSYTGNNNFPLFLQTDPQWSKIPYGPKKDADIGDSGCGPTSLAMVIAGLTGNKTVNPKVVADYSNANGYVNSNSDTSWSLFTSGAKNFGLNGKEISVNANNLTESLKNGKPIIASMRKGDFTTTGHIIVLTGITPDGKILVNDPASKKRTGMQWDINTIVSQSKAMFSLSKN